MMPLPDLLTCAKRELALRKGTYPKWVASGRMKPDAAKHEIDCMEGIVERLRMLLHLEEASQDLPHRHD